MNIQQLRYFLVLADTLSFTKTAEKYYISQTAVSNQIKALEEVAALYDGVMEGKYDIISNLPLPGKKKSGLKEMVLARYPLYVAVPPQHPFAEFHSLKREQLADEIFISYRQNALSEYDPTQAILAK